MQFIDLKAQYATLKVEINNKIQDALDNGQYIMGKHVMELEDQLAKYIDVKHCITCANGTDALQMAFMYYKIGMGDAIFCPDITFIASVEPACMLGATPVFCNIDKDTYNLCPESLERRIIEVKEKGLHMPKAVVAVDFLGNPAAYNEINTICEKHKLILIEDAAQGFGAEYNGKKCGSFGDVATTSFFPAKPLGCYGDGGAIFTDNDEIADVLRSIRVHGKGASKYDNIRVGVNSRLDTIQAAILQVKLQAFIDFEFEARQKVAMRYNEAFKDKFKTPYVSDNCKSVYAQYALLCNNKEQRDALIDRLNANSIPNMVYYPTPQHKLKVYEDNIYNNAEFSVSDDYCDRTISLPMHPYLNVKEQDVIIGEINENWVN